MVIIDLFVFILQLGHIKRSKVRNVTGLHHTNRIKNRLDICISGCGNSYSYLQVFTTQDRE